MVPDQKDLLLFQNALEKMVSSRYLSTKLVDSIDGGIDFASQLRLGFRHRGHNLPELDVAHHQHVHIASDTLLAPGHRAVEEGKPDSIAQRRQGSSQDIGHPGRFDDDGFELREDRAFRVGLEVNLAAAESTADDAGIGQLLQLSLNGAVAAACRPHNLAKVELLVRTAIKQPQNRPAVPAKEGLR